MRPHAHNCMGVTLVVSGSFQDAVEGRTAVCRPLTLVVKPEGAEHATRVGPNGALTIYFEFTPVGAHTLAQLGVGLERCGYFIAGPMTALLLALLGSDCADRNMRVAKTFADAIASRRNSSPPVDTAANAEFAIGTLRGSTRAAATAAEMHPVSFARLFRRATGLAPSIWRLHHRVAQAADALADGRESIASVAHATGFADQAHLCRTFRRETGLTPGQYRELLLAFRAECG